MNRSVAAVTLGACIWLAACTVGPNYHRPPAPQAPAWKAEAPWTPAAPKESIPKGAWWEVFHDEELNQYERQVLAANQTLAAARDRLDQARAFARVVSAGLFPQLATDPSAERNRVSGNRQLLTAPPPLRPDTENLFAVPFSINYEPDLFGRVRRNLEAANASLQASAADLQNVQLVLTAEAAADYFSVRELDAEIAVVQSSVEYQEKALQLVEKRHLGGVASGLDVAQQQAVLESTRTQISLLQQQRLLDEHALATLTGVPPASLSIPVRPLQAEPPAIPVGVPSDVLQRRPDIATAERQMAAANAQIGVAKTAFYPSILLGGTGGWQSRDITTLASAPSTFWALGANVLQTIFNGGLNHAQLAFAQSGYEASVATYRQSVLSAFQQVEDGLSGLSTLAAAADTQQRAVEASQRALTIANNRYVGGLVTYLDVITAEETLLTNQRLASQLLGQRLVTSVYLVKALGGGWDAASLQDIQVKPRAGQIWQQ
jgi:NodT family efflux transporter outer membrane factor (OMF) lipoprotein